MNKDGHDMRVIPVSEMNPAPYNPRVELKPDDPEYQHIKNSLDSFGYLDPIVWNERTGNIVSGHQRYRILVDGGATELLVRVVDFDEDTEKACNLAMNKAVGLWDEEKLEALLSEMKNTSWDMTDFGFDDEELESLGEEENPYTQNINAPIYEPTGETPELSDLCDTTKADELMDGIRNADIPDDIKEFLYLASSRHLKFNYKKIAEYYCHAPKEVQELFEKSALVIIDFNSAIENGFVRLTERIAELREGDADE